MIENIIQQIKTAEESSKAMLETAKTDAVSLVEKAYADSDKSIKATELEVKDKIRIAKEKASKDASVEKAKLEKAFEEKVIHLKQASAIKKEAIVNQVISKIIEQQV